MWAEKPTLLYLTLKGEITKNERICYLSDSMETIFEMPEMGEIGCDKEQV